MTIKFIDRGKNVDVYHNDKFKGTVSYDRALDLQYEITKLQLLDKTILLCESHKNGLTAMGYRR